MIIYYESDGDNVSITIPEPNFINAVERDFWKRIKMFNESESKYSVYRLYPETKKEAEWMMFAYCQLVELSETLPQWLQAYFSDSFKDILDGANPKNALGLVSPAHRPKTNQFDERNKGIFSNVCKLMESGNSLEDAVGDVAIRVNLSDSLILKIYCNFKEMERDLDELKKNIPF